jgi:ParB family chromosome partitioning protein
MGKADDLIRSAGGSILESASHRSAPAAMPVAPGVSTLTPDRLAGVARSKAALDIPVEKIARDPDQPREEFEEDALGRLADSIRARGVLQPIRVRWDEGQGRYVIICGERRWRAARMAGIATIPCVVAERPAGPGELLTLQLVENALREDLRPIEQAKAYRTLMTVNSWSGNQLSKELSISQSGVAQALALLDLPVPVQGHVESGDLPASTAYAIATLDDPDAQRAIADRAVSEKLSRAEVAQAVRRAGGSKGRGSKAKPRKVTERTFRTAAGKVTVENRRGLGDDVIRSALAEALAQLDKAADRSADAA